MMKRLELINRFTVWNLGELTEGVTVHKIMVDFVIHDEPLKVFLKHAVSHTIAEFVDDCIEAWFGCIRLPTAIEDGDEIIAHLSDQVTM